MNVPNFSLEDICGITDMGGKKSLPPFGNTEAKIMLVFANPSPDDFREGKLMGGKTGDEILAAFEFAEINPEDVWVTSVVKHSLSGKTKPSAEQIKDNIDLLKREIELVKPKLLVAFGAEAFKAILHKNAKHSEFCGNIIETPLGKTLVTYNPFQVFAIDPKIRNQFKEHLHLAKKFVCDELNYEPFDWVVLNDPKENTKYIDKYVANKDFSIGIDLEWKGTCYKNEVLYSLQYCCEKNFCVILDISQDGETENTALLESMRPLLEHKDARLLGWNIRAELKRLKLRGFNIPEESVAFDGMKAVAFFDSRWNKGLETGIRYFTNYEPYYVAFYQRMKELSISSENMSDMKFQEPDLFYKYAAGDGVAHREACLNMRKHFPEKLKEYYYNTYLPLSSYMLDMEMAGIEVDTKLMLDITKKYKTAYDSLYSRLLNQTKAYGFDSSVYDELLKEYMFEFKEEGLPTSKAEKKAKLVIKNQGVYRDFNPNYYVDKQILLFDILNLNPVFYNYNKKPKPREWYEKQKPSVQEKCTASTNAKTISTLRFELKEKQENDDSPQLQKKIELVETLLDLARVNVFANKFFATKGTEFEVLVATGTEDSEEDEESLKSSYWTNLCPDGRIHSDFYECLDNFRASSRPNVQNPASKVLAHIPDIFSRLNTDTPKNIRNIFYAGGDPWHWCEMDIAGADVYLAALLSGDKKFISDFRSGSFHVKKMREYFQDPKLSKKDVSKYVSAKSITFRIFYTAGLDSAALPIQYEIFAESGYYVPIETIRYALSTWNRYETYMGYRQHCQDMAVDAGYIENARGMRYYFDKTEEFGVLAGWQNQALAFSVASELALFMWEASIQLKKYLQKEGLWMKYVFPVCSVHDATYLKIHKDLLKGDYLPEVLKYFYCEHTPCATGDYLGAEVVIADCWKGKNIVFEKETKWDDKQKKWIW